MPATTTSSARKIAFVANSDWYLYNFRTNLIKSTKEAGWDIHLICTEGGYIHHLREHGWPTTSLPLETRGSNPLREAVALFKLIRSLRAIRPDVVHLFTLKCVLYGCLAYPLLGKVRIVGALTGMGYLFTSKKASVKLLKSFVTAALKLSLKLSGAELIFQNEADRLEFVQNKLISKKRTHVIRGSGVDCQRFHPANRKPPARKNTRRLLYCGRLISEKGIYDYLEATQQLAETGYSFESRIAGDPYPGNPSSLTANEVHALKSSHIHQYLGHFSDMPELLADTDIVVLPTYYREGTPKILLEAAASGCVLVTTTIPACESLLEEGSSGHYISPRSPKELSNALKHLLDIDPQKLADMQGRSREIALENFSDTEVNQRTQALYD